MSDKYFTGCITNEKYSIEKKLGEGGQGQVILVSKENTQEKYAIKWYHKNAATDGQKSRIQTLIDTGAPESNLDGINFIWPIEMVTFSASPDSFGYVMPIIDTSKFKTFQEIRRSRVKQPNVSVLSRISLLLVKSLEIIHSKGCAYCDINTGNIMFDVESGDIVICDVDNIVTNNSKVEIMGVWEFMAPEVALGKSMPNRDTDLYSLAVLLFTLWVWEHPMDGDITLNQKYCMDIPAKKEHFARNPIFAYHPEGNRNCAKKVQILSTARERWNRMCPDKLKSMFIKVFTDGVNNVLNRVTTPEWINLFAMLSVNSINCPFCTAINVWDGENTGCKCFNCKNEIPLGLCLRISKAHSTKIILVQNDITLNLYHLGTSTYDNSSLKGFGIIVEHPKMKGVFGLRNLTEKSWTYNPPSEEAVEIKPNEAKPLKPGGTILIDNCKIEILQFSDL